jgi:hypothetical protein
MELKKLRRLLAKLDPVLPMTRKYERLLSERGQFNMQEEWYSTQKEHWIGWLSAYDGPGYYNRKNSNRDARFVYNHINCPPMLFWLCEASGVKKSLLLKAMDSALDMPCSFPSQCKLIRTTVPWETVEQALMERK